MTLERDLLKNTFDRLCGYTPFDYEAASQADELQNILHSRYSFAAEYWYDVSDMGKAGPMQNYL